MKKVNLTKMQIGAAAVVILVLFATVAAIRIKASRETPVEVYSYNNVMEQVLADEVTTYLHGAADLGEEISARTANEAVESYRLIIQSDVDTVNDEHTNAIQDRVSASLQASEDGNLTREDITALSAGVAEIVWKTVLSQIETVTENVKESEYFYLAESLQGQIKELEERKMKVSIRANIKNNTEMTPDELLAMVEGMTDQELEALAKSMGLSLEELQNLLESYQSDTGKETDSKLKELEEKLTREIREIGAGEDGKNGKDGTQGERGQEGKAGNSGASGKSVFIRYSEKANGESMTERPTAATKYMGTYTGAKASVNPSDYSWSQYVGNDGNSVFIRYATSENGANMTKQPNSDTKYMGTYIGVRASADPEEYTWTRYSDATISFSNGTLYITQ